MHTTHHPLMRSSRVQRVLTSTSADTWLSDFSDAERRGRAVPRSSGVVWHPCAAIATIPVFTCQPTSGAPIGVGD